MALPAFADPVAYAPIASIEDNMLMRTESLLAEVNFVKCPPLI